MRKIKKYKIVVSSQAKVDLYSIKKFIALDNDRAAESFIKLLIKKIKTLADFPGRCPYVRESQIVSPLPYQRLIYNNYYVIYRVEFENVLVIRVINAARDLESLFQEGWEQ